MPPALHPPAEELAPLLNGGIKLPPLPASAPELLAMMRHSVDALEVAQVARLVERDPALAVLLLKLANSPAYAGAQAVTRVGQAIMFLGLEETLQFLNFHLLRNSFSTVPKAAGFSLDPFWKHAWAVGIAARQLGRQDLLIHALPGELYLGGLLHDMGKMILALHLPQVFERCLAEAAGTDRPLDVVEREVMGLDHAQLAGRLLTTWRLPPLLIEAIGAHHNPSQALPEARELATLIELANGLAHEAAFGISGNPRPKLREDCLLSWPGDHPLRYQGPLFAQIVQNLRTRVTPDEAMAASNEAPHGGRTGNDTEPNLPRPAARKAQATDPALPAPQPAARAEEEPPAAAPKRGWLARLLGR